ncbi:MAG: PQQ-dependent sugar dehydrogenase [Bacteroidota bacterium]
MKYFSILFSISLVIVGITPSLSLQAQTFTDEGFSVTNISGALPNDVVGFSLLPVDNDERILMIRRSGSVHVLLNSNLSASIGSLNDINSTANIEQGLLGITVHPSFPDSNYVYLFYTRNDNANEVLRCRINGDLTDPQSTNLSLDLSTREKLVDFINEAPFHQGGALRFGPDDKLYIAHGDDARKHFIQDYRNYRGKILRLNPNGSIPSDNPSFPNTIPDALGGIFATGLRNPFRMAIDPQDGSLFIGDVGANLQEELNIATGGENFGWPRYEGAILDLDTARLLDPNPVAPILSYAHATGNFSVIALSAYRPVDFPNDQSFSADYDGALFYADYYSGPLYALIPDGNGGYTRKNFAQGFVRLIDGAIAPDGSLLLLEYGKALQQISFEDTSATAIDPQFVEQVQLRCVPNPLQDHTNLRFSLPTQLGRTSVNLQVFDQSGRLLRSLLQTELSPGMHECSWDGRGASGEPLPAGIYFVRLSLGDLVVSEELIVQ